MDGEDKDVAERTTRVVTALLILSRLHDRQITRLEEAGHV